MFTPIAPDDLMKSLFINTFELFFELKYMCAEVDPSSTKSSWHDGTDALAVVSISIPKWFAEPVLFCRVMRGATPCTWNNEVGEIVPIPVKPFTFRPVRVPNEVIFDCVAPETVIAVVARGTVPVMMEPVSEVKPDPFPVNTPVELVMFPVTVRLVRVPVDVMLLCAGFVTFPAVVEVATVPVMQLAGTVEDKPAVMFEMIGNNEVMFEVLMTRLAVAEATPDAVR